MPKGSEDSLLEFARRNPQLAGGFIKQLRTMGEQVKTVIFPSVLGEVQNREIAVKISREPAVLAEIVDQNGVLDLFDFLCFVNEFNDGC